MLRTLRSLSFIAIATLVAVPAFAGDFCVLVCDPGNDASAHQTCPGVHVRTSEQMRNDLGLAARGEDVSWPTFALVNGQVSFCSAAERKVVMAAVVENMADTTTDRRRQLVDFACMVAPKTALSAFDAALKRSDLTPAQRKQLSRARAQMRKCADSR